MLTKLKLAADLPQTTVRSSRPEVFCKTRVLKKFTKFTGKHLCQSLFFNKVADLSLQLYLKRDSGTGAFR